MKIVTKLARGIGSGVVAGFAGTAAMTVSSTVEAKLRSRAFSDASRQDHVLHSPQKTLLGKPRPAQGRKAVRGP